MRRNGLVGGLWDHNKKAETSHNLTITCLLPPLIHPFPLSHIPVETRDQPHFRLQPPLQEESGEPALTPVRRPRSYDVQTSYSSPPLFHVIDESATAKYPLWFRNDLMSKYL